MTTSEQIAAIGTVDRPKHRWRAESDGDPHRKVFYVIDSFTLNRRDCASMKDARGLAKELNAQCQTSSTTLAIR
jgi:hypothetical protein